VVVGGFAMIHAGHFRATDDIDLLLETTPDNEARVIEALMRASKWNRRRLQPNRLD
jgi:hypothetical protein